MLWTTFYSTTHPQTQKSSHWWQKKPGLIKRFIHKYIKPWFFSQYEPEKIKVPYVISFVFLGLTIFAICTHLTMKIWQFRQIRKLWKAQGLEGLDDILTFAKRSFYYCVIVLFNDSCQFINKSVNYYELCCSF